MQGALPLSAGSFYDDDGYSMMEPPQEIPLSDEKSHKLTLAVLKECLKEYKTLHRTVKQNNNGSGVLAALSFARSHPVDLFKIIAASQQALAYLKQPSPLDIASDFAGYINLLCRLKKYVNLAETKNLRLYFQNYVKGESASKAIVEKEVKQLTLALEGHILSIEAKNKAKDLKICLFFLEKLMKGTSESLLNDIPEGSIPTLISNSAAKESLSQHFGIEIVDHVYRHYRVDHCGMIRLKDFKRLAMGIISRLYFDKSMGSEADLIAIFHSLTSKLPLRKFKKTTMPNQSEKLTSKYWTAYQQDKAFLRAAQASEYYRDGNLNLGALKKFSFVEQDCLFLAPAYREFTHSTSFKPRLYPSYTRNKKLHYLEVHPIGESKAGLLALIPVSQRVQFDPPYARFLILDVDFQENNKVLVEQVDKCFKSALEIGCKQKMRIDICIPAQDKSSQLKTLFFLLDFLKDNERSRHLAEVNLFFQGAPIVSEQTAKDFLRDASFFSEKECKIAIRYFLSDKYLPVIPQGMLLGAIPKEYSIPKFFYATLVKFEAEKNGEDKSPSLFFSAFDNRGIKNNAYISEFLTNHAEDCQVFGKEGSSKAEVMAMSLLNAYLSPPPPSTLGISSMAYNILTSPYYWWYGNKNTSI